MSDPDPTHIWTRAVAELVRQVHWRGAQARFGRIRDDGRIGGPDG
jgi:hypothetical protein